MIGALARAVASSNFNFMVYKLTKVFRRSLFSGMLVRNSLMSDGSFLDNWCEMEQGEYAANPNVAFVGNEYDVEAGEYRPVRLHAARRGVKCLALMVSIFQYSNLNSKKYQRCCKLNCPTLFNAFQ